MDEHGTADGFADTAMSPTSLKGTEESADALVSGARLSPTLKVVRELGRGAQGGVYEVEDEASGERQAIKLVDSELPDDPRYLQRLKREALTASAVDHPNVTKIYGLEQTPDGRAFIRMELLHGRPLDVLIREAPIPIEVACRIAADVARGLGAVHERGIIHRDVKPQNVFVVDTPDGPLAKVVDFGIAKAAASWDLTALTSTGSLIGTPAYMSPEQILMPATVDHRSDIYSLGLVLYEMLAGRRAFVAKEIPQVLMMHAQNPPPDLRAARPEVPRSVAHVVTRCLEKDPLSRFQSMRELLRAIEAADARPDVTARPRVAMVNVAPPRRARWGARIATAAILAIVAGGVFSWLERAEAPNRVAPSDTAAVAAPAPQPPPSPSPSIPSPSPAPATPAAPVQNGVAVVHSAPSGASVFSGGALLGTTPLDVPLTPNTDLPVDLTHYGHAQKTIVLHVEPGERKLFSVRLERAPRGLRWKQAQPPPPTASPAPGFGWVEITSKLRAEVLYEGRSIGTTPIEVLRLPVGRASLRFVNVEAGVDTTRTVVVTADELTKVTLDLGRR